MSRAASKVYVPLDVAFFDDARIVAAGERAAWLYLNMLCKAKGLDSDGVLTRQQVARLSVPGWSNRLTALAEAGAIAIDGESVSIVGWLNWNESSGERRSRHEEDRKRKKEAAERRAAAQEGGTP